mgnify:CR=1 FL=1
MTKNKYLTLLSDDQKKEFYNFSNEVTFNSKTQIIYSGQIPMAAYLLLEGSITLKDAQKRVIRTCDPNSLLGFSEIYNNQSYRYTAEIDANSKVLILDRSTIKEMQSKLDQSTVDQTLSFQKLVESA